MADYTVVAANVIASSNVIRYYATNGLVAVAGSNITAGMPVYQNPDTLLFFPVDANDPAGSAVATKAVGIAENTAYTGQPLFVVIRDPAFQPGITTLLAGDVVIASGTAGGLKEAGGKASGDYVSVLGIATSTTTMNLNAFRSDVAKV